MSNGTIELNTKLITIYSSDYEKDTIVKDTWFLDHKPQVKLVELYPAHFCTGFPLEAEVVLIINLLSNKYSRMFWDHLQCAVMYCHFFPNADFYSPITGVERMHRMHKPKPISRAPDNESDYEALANEKKDK